MVGNELHVKRPIPDAHNTPHAAKTVNEQLSLAAEEVRGSSLIRFLANIFRGLSYIIGITAPDPGQNERPFVLLWLGMIAFVLVASGLILYLLPTLGVP